MATLRTDGFVGVQGPVTEGLITTIPLNVTGPNLYITVDVEPAGSIRIGALGYPGLGMIDMEAPVKKTSTRVKIVFQNNRDFSDLLGKEVALQAGLDHATLYTIAFAQ